LAKQSPESDSASADDALTPAFWTDEQAAAYLGLTEHQLYLYRRRGGGPPFVQFGVRVRYQIALAAPGAMRCDLSGAEVEAVDAQHAEEARRRLEDIAARRAAKRAPAR
jgi:hypothetical protein